MVGKYPYIYSTNKLRHFLNEFHKRSVGEKVTGKAIQQMGYSRRTSQNIRKILEFLGFVDSSKKPTRRYREYRDKTKQKKIMADSLLESYSDLFGMYPDACKRDKEALANFFRPVIEVGDRTLNAKVDTFMVLCEYADFDLVSVQDKSDSDKTEVEHIVRKPSGLTLNLNIQLVLPETKDTSIYDALFKSLRENLLE